MLDKNLAAWDIPVTDEFLDGVRRGIRRRRLLRGAAVGGGTLLATATVTAVALGLGAPSSVPRNGTPPAASASAQASVAGPALDGFHLTRLPRGAVRVGADSSDIVAVTQDGLHTVDAGPAPGQPWATVTVRRFDRGEGIGLFVSVLRPRPGTSPAADSAQVADWLVEWSARGSAPIRTFDVPSGAARLYADVGTQVTTHHVVITTAGHVVITIEGNAAFTAAEMETVARGIAG